MNKLINFARVTKKYFADIDELKAGLKQHELAHKEDIHKGSLLKAQESMRGLNEQEKKQYEKDLNAEKQKKLNRLEDKRRGENLADLIDLILLAWSLGELVMLGRSLILAGKVSPKIWNAIKALFAKGKPTKGKIFEIFMGKASPKLSQIAFKQVDDLPKYVKVKKLKFSPAKKSGQIVARPAKEGEKIATYVNGKLETTNIAKSGDMIVYNKGTPDNKWIIGKDTFNKKYELLQDNIFKPKGAPMNAAKVTENIKFTAPWGEEMMIEKGGYILQDMKNPNDIYGIAEDAFKKTYEFMK